MKLNLLNLIVLSLFTIGLSSQKALINHAAVKSDAQKLNPLVPLSDPELLGFDCNVLNHAIQNQLKMTARTPLKKLLDSTYSFQIDTLGKETLNYKYFNRYNSLGLREYDLSVIIHPDGSQTPEYQSEYLYNHMASYSEYISSYWDSGLNTMVLDEKIQYEYNMDDQIAMEKIFQYEDNVWKPIRLKVYHYNHDNLVNRLEQFKWDVASQDFKSSSKTEYFYDNLNHLIRQENSNWNSGTNTFVNYLLIEHEYQGDLLIGRLIKLWNAQSSVWVNQNKDHWERNASGLVLYYNSSSYDPAANLFIPSFKVTYFRDMENDISSSHFETWNKQSNKYILIGKTLNYYSNHVIISGTTGSEYIDHQILVAPNPAKEFLQLELADDDMKEGISVRLLDIQGRVVGQWNNLNVGNNRLELSQYNSGFYMLSLDIKQGIINKKLFIE